MRANDVAVDFITKVLSVEQHRRIGWQHLFAPVGEVEYFASFAAVVRTLGDADYGKVFDAEFAQHFHDAGELSLAPVDQHEVGPHAFALAVGVVLHRAGKAPLHHLAHHRKVIIGLRGLDVELAIL